MKKQWIWILLPFLLAGCGTRDTFETVADEPAAEVAVADPARITVKLPEDAVAPVLQNESRQLYLCEDYEILLENRPGGDLAETIRYLSGYERDRLTVMHTTREGVQRYEFVWAAAGEEGTRLGRAVVLDDGRYHYCLSVLRDADPDAVSQILWEDVFSSFALV